MAFKNGILKFTEEELADMARFDAEIDADDSPLTPEEYAQSRFNDELCFPEWAKECERKRNGYQRKVAEAKAAGSYDELRTKEREYRQAHSEEIKARKRRWYLENREKIREQQRGYHMRRKDAQQVAA